MAALSALAIQPAAATAEHVADAPAAGCSDKRTATLRYRVQPGDTLSSIGALLGVSWQRLYEQNASLTDQDPDRLEPGTVLRYTIDNASVYDGRNPASPAPKWHAPVLGGRVTAAYHVPGRRWAAGYHTGVDLAVPEGTRLRSIGPGCVVQAGWNKWYGNRVLVRMDDGHYVLYAHLSQLQVAKGDRVAGGARLGLSGQTGQATGPHLHFEVRRTKDYGTDVNPVAYLAAHRVRLP